MIVHHNIHSIDADLIKAHLSQSGSALRDVDNQLQEQEDPGAKSIGSDILKRWRAFDQELRNVEEVIRKPGSDYKDLYIYKPYESNQYVIALRNSDGTVNYKDLSNDDKETLWKLDPDYFIASVIDAPIHQRKLAYELWLEDALNRTPIYSSTLSLSVSVEVLWFEMSAEVSYQQERFPDGRVMVTFSVSADVGATMKIGSAGIEAGLQVTHEFDGVREAEAFLAKLSERLVDLDLEGAGNILGARSSLESCIGSVGVYASAELDIPGWLETSASVSVGYGRDFITREHLIYFSGSCAIEVDIGDIESKLEVNILGEQRWNSDGGSYVDVELALGVLAEVELDELNRLLPGLDLSTGCEVVIRAYLELDDVTAIDAWKNLLNPLDGSLDLDDFLDRADVTLQASSVTEIEFIDLDIDAKVASLEVESDQEKHVTTDLWVKAPGEGIRKVEL